MLRRRLDGVLEIIFARTSSDAGDSRARRATGLAVGGANRPVTTARGAGCRMSSLVAAIAVDADLRESGGVHGTTRVVVDRLLA